MEQQVRLSKYGHVMLLSAYSSLCFVLVPPPGVVSVSVSSTALSWSVASDSVASSEVVWRETDRGTESSSGSLTGTSYTIDQLESTTIYTVTVRATNVAGTTDSHTIFISTGICRVADRVCSHNANTAPRSDCSELNTVPIVVSTVVVFGTLSLCAIVAVTISVVACYNRDNCGPSRRYMKHY